jgi:nitroreductase
MVFRAIAKFPRKKPGLLPETKPVYDLILGEIKKRASIRRYTDEAVSDAIINQVIEAARWAPSEGDSQPWEFVVVRNRELKAHIMEAAFHQTWMLEAPVFIVACINTRISRALYGERGEKLYGIQSVAAAIQNMLLAAEAIGLGTCWVGAFSEHQVAVLLHCPDYIRPCAIITLGWPAETPVGPEPHKLAEIVHWEKYGETALRKRIIREKAKP